MSTERVIPVEVARAYGREALDRINRAPAPSPAEQREIDRFGIFDQEALVEVSEWEDPDENDGEWPYPTRYTKWEASGELADRCRRALGVETDEPVFITERVESGGYSEFTQEDWTDFTVTCGDASQTFDEIRWGDSSFEQLLKWLDRADGGAAR